MSSINRILGCTGGAVVLGAMLFSGSAHAAENPAGGTVVAHSDNLNWDTIPADVARCIADRIAEIGNNLNWD
ncbi:hypothetical protein [Streptomyces sp. NPDC005408]|uniref:hypothetical protein n=1 Tax=Streptomyces sp. NPDC005408 TaxID=3155341 RepID=UPI0033BD1A56